MSLTPNGTNGHMQAGAFGRIPSNLPAQGLDTLMDEAIQAPHDAAAWEALLDRLKDIEKIDDLSITQNTPEQRARRAALEAAFFAYVEKRDVVRGRAMCDDAARLGIWRPDPHAGKIKLMVETEAATLARVLNLTGVKPAYFSFLGSGSAPETLLHIRRLSQEGTLPALRDFYAIDNRDVATDNARALFGHLGYDDCHPRTMRAEDFKPQPVEGILLTAAYLHPGKDRILQDTIKNLEAPTILMVRNMMNGHALFGETVDQLTGQQKIASVSHKSLGVSTDYYLIVP